MSKLPRHPKDRGYGFLKACEYPKTEINMKTFEIEVVRTYTTTIEIALPDELTTSTVERITLGNTVEGNTVEWDTKVKSFEDDVYHEIWDTLGEAELEQCDTEILTVKAKERKSGKQLFDELGWTSEKG